MKAKLLAAILAPLAAPSAQERLAAARGFALGPSAVGADRAALLNGTSFASSATQEAGCESLCGPPGSTTLCYMKDGLPYCMCEGPMYTAAEKPDGSVICERTDWCSISPCGTQDVGKCVSDPSTSSGYNCECNAGYAVDENDGWPRCVKATTTTTQSPSFTAAVSTLTVAATEPQISPPTSGFDDGPSTAWPFPDDTTNKVESCSSNPCGASYAVLRCTDSANGPLCECRRGFVLKTNEDGTEKCEALPSDDSGSNSNGSGGVSSGNGVASGGSSSESSENSKDEAEEESKTEPSHEEQPTESAEKEEEEEEEEEEKDHLASTLISGDRVAEGEDSSWLVGVVATVAGALVVLALVATAVCIYTSPKREQLKKQMEEEEAAEDAQRRAFLEAAAMEAFNSEGDEDV